MNELTQQGLLWIFAILQQKCFAHKFSLFDMKLKITKWQCQSDTHKIKLSFQLISYSNCGTASGFNEEQRANYFPCIIKQFAIMGKCENVWILCFFLLLFRTYLPQQTGNEFEFVRGKWNNRAIHMQIFCKKRVSDTC